MPSLPGDFLLSPLNTAAFRSSAVIGISSISLQASGTHLYPVSNFVLTLYSSTCMGQYLPRMCSLNTRTISLADFSHPWSRSCTSETSRCPLSCLRLMKWNRYMLYSWKMSCVRRSLCPRASLALCSFTIWALNMIKLCPPFHVMDRALQYIIKTGVMEVFHLCFLSSLHSPFMDEEFLDVHFCHSFPPHHHGRVGFGLFGPFCPTLPQLFLETFLTQ